MTGARQLSLGVCKLLAITPLDSKQEQGNNKASKGTGDVILLCKNKRCVKDVISFFYVQEFLFCVCGRGCCLVCSYESAAIKKVELMTLVSY